MLNIGQSAPDFSLPNAEGETLSLASFSGKRVLLWFFPRASTPGCTAQGCGLRDNHSAFLAQDIQIVGVSMDSPRKQKNFVTKQSFPFTMLCDQPGDMVRAYGAWGPKKFMGREYEGILRIAYLLGADGTVEATFPKVKTKSFAADVLASLD